MNTKFWQQLGTDRHELLTTIRQYVTPDNYGPHGWCMGDFFHGGLSEPVRRAAMLHLDGWDHRESRLGYDRPGAGIMVTLEVLSRQACNRDAAGNELNRDDIAPNAPPLDGDLIRFQTGMQHPPERLLTQGEFCDALARGEDKRIFFEVKVQGGRIRVPYPIATLMLAMYGFRIAGAQHTTFAPSKRELEIGALTGDKPRTRVISNWWFREVFDDGTAPPQKQNDDPEALPTRRKRGE
jgi:hypothetical protein